MLMLGQSMHKNTCITGNSIQNTLYKQGIALHKCVVDNTADKVVHMRRRCSTKMRLNFREDLFQKLAGWCGNVENWTFEWKNEKRRETKIYRSIHLQIMVWHYVREP